jgi:hypothetical protein
MRILITIFLVTLLVGSGHAQIKFFKLYTNNGADFGQGVVQLEDSSYVITGSSSSFADGPSQAFLLKIDSVGNYKWSNHYGGSEVESGRRVLYKKNFGFFICGYTNSFGNGGFDYYLAKVDENANLEWETSIGGYGWEQVHDAALTRDTGAIMVGETSSNVTDNKDIYIVRTDIDGDTLWTKTIGGSGDDYASSITKHNDSMFVIGGRTWVEDSLLTKAYMTYIKDDGTVFWTDTFGVNGDYWINDIEFVGGRFVAVGGASGEGNDGIDYYYNEVDVNGNLLGWIEEVNTGDEDHMYVTTYGLMFDLYTVAHAINPPGTFPGGEDVLVHKFTSGYIYLNGFGIGHTNPDIAGQIIRTSDGAALIVGYSTGVISGGNEIFVAKIGPGVDDYPDNIVDVAINNLVIVDELNETSELNVYPNPASGVIQIETDQSGYASVNLIDATGKRLRSEGLNFNLSMDVSMLPAGWYILEFVGKDLETVHKKLIVQK